MPADRVPTPNARHFLGSALALTALTVYGSLIPFWYRPMPIEEAIAQFREIRYFDPTLLYARGDWVVNMVQYAALTFCWAGALGVDRRPAAGLIVAAILVPLGGAFATALEFAQVYFAPRTVSRNDLWVEWAGVAGGAVGWLLVGPSATAWLRRFWGREGLAGLASQALPAYLLLLLVLHAMPFDVVLGRDELARKYAEGRIRLVPFVGLIREGPGALVDTVGTALAFAPLGVLLGLIPRWDRLRWPEVLGLGAATVTVLELVQLFMFTRTSDVSDVFIGAAGVLLGWRAARAVRGAFRSGRLGADALRAWWAGGRGRRGATLGWLALVAWFATLALASWWPLHFTTVATEFRGVDPDLTDENSSIVGLRRMSWLPFVDYYWGSRYQALDQLVALGVGRRERLGAAATMLAALALGTILEVGQYFLPDRHPGTTDVLIHVFGAWLAFALTRHVVHAIGPDTESLGHARYAYAASTAAAIPPRVRAGGGGLGRWPRPLAGTARRLVASLDAPLAWLDRQPEGVRLALFCAAAVILTVGFIKVALLMGWV
jgi:glycopeptide antibiotics resistance protein